jgi:hypothetical protein
VRRAVMNLPVEFAWSGDPPLHGGHVRFIVQGTKVAYLLIPLSDEEMKKIMSDSPGAIGFIPIIWMRRTETGNEKQQESSVEKWEITTEARLINAAEFQYRFAHGIYADYSTLLRSGQLQKTGGRQFTLVPKNLQSATDPLPGYELLAFLLGIRFHANLPMSNSTRPGPVGENYSISPAGSGRSPFQDSARHHLHNRQCRSHARFRAETHQ